MKIGIDLKYIIPTTNKKPASKAGFFFDEIMKIVYCYKI